jgi:hypothetical protein
MYQSAAMRIEVSDIPNTIDGVSIIVLPFGSDAFGSQRKNDPSAGYSQESFSVKLYCENSNNGS